MDIDEIKVINANFDTIETYFKAQSVINSDIYRQIRELNKEILKKKDKKSLVRVIFLGGIIGTLFALMKGK